MGQLSPRQIARFYTLNEIETKISEYQEYLDRAAQGAASIDTTAGNQRTTPPDDVDKISSLLQTWLKAHEIKTGGSPTYMYSGDYRPKKGPY